MSTIAKAIVGALAAGVAYLVGVIPAEGGFGDLSTVQWLGLIPVVLTALGIVWAVPNQPAEGS